MANFNGVHQAGAQYAVPLPGTANPSPDSTTRILEPILTIKTIRPGQVLRIREVGESTTSILYTHTNLSFVSVDGALKDIQWICGIDPKSRAKISIQAARIMQITEDATPKILAEMFRGSTSPDAGCCCVIL